MDDPIVRTIEAFLAELLKVKARTAALEVALIVAVKKPETDQETLWKMIDDVSALYHQALLERTETLDPGLAARIDVRKEFPDIPDAFL